MYPISDLEPITINWDFIFSQFRDDLIDILNENLNTVSFPKENKYQLGHT